MGGPQWGVIARGKVGEQSQGILPPACGKKPENSS